MPRGDEHQAAYCPALEDWRWQAQCSRELGQPGSLGNPLPPGRLADRIWRANPGLAPLVKASQLEGLM
jgi:hypothetical protein